MKRVENGTRGGRYYTEFTIDHIPQATSPVQVFEFETPEELLAHLASITPFEGEPVLALRLGPIGMCAVKITPQASVLSIQRTFPVATAARTRTVIVDPGCDQIRFGVGSVRIEGITPQQSPFTTEVYYLADETEAR